MPRPDPEKSGAAYAPPVVTPGPATLPSPPPPPPPSTPADRAAAWRARRPLVLRVLAVLAAQFCAALAVGLGLALTPASRAYVRAHSWPVAASALAAVAAWIALAVSQAKTASAAAPAAWGRARPPLLAAFSALLALFLGTLGARVPGAAALTAAVGVGALVFAAVVAAAVGLDLTRAGALATGLLWAAALTAGATAWVARTHGDRWWLTLLAGLATAAVAVYLALDVQALAGLGPLAGGGRWGWRGGGLARPDSLADDDWVGGAAALATDVGLGFVAVAALASGGRL